MVRSSLLRSSAETATMSDPETLRIKCPNLTCQKILAVPAAARGKTVRCRGCATNIRIPEVAKPKAAEDEAADTSAPAKP